jgi:hypothetical protein
VLQDVQRVTENIKWEQMLPPSDMENNIKKSFALSITVLKIVDIYPPNKYTHLFRLFSYCNFSPLTGV